MSKNWTPAPYMEEAMEWVLKRDGSGLMLDPGMRKTSITLACVDILHSVGEIRKTLVIAPLRVCKTVWKQEGRKWTNFNHLRIVDMTGMSRDERYAVMRQDHHVYLINHANCADYVRENRTLPGVLSQLPADFDMLVLDESTKFKDTQTKQFKALKKVIFNFKRRVILTGTPIPNGLKDLFGQMFVVDLGASLGKYITHFRNEFCYQRPGDQYNWHLRAGSDALIYKRVANRLMRLDIRDHIEMPELVPNFIEVNLPEKLRPTYRAMEKDFIIQMDTNPIVAANPAVAGGKLRQIANGFLYEGLGPARVTHRLHDEKLAALENLVEEMQGRPLLVAYEFDDDQEVIMGHFDGTGDKPLAIDLGRCKDPERVVEQFNRGEIPLLIAHPASAGHGLNLQEVCDTLCWYGITWNLEWYDQFNARVYRSGQKSPRVLLHHIVCKGTKDEDVMNVLESKDRTQVAFNQAIKQARA